MSDIELVTGGATKEFITRMLITKREYVNHDWVNCIVL